MSLTATVALLFALAQAEPASLQYHLEWTPGPPPQVAITQTLTGDGDGVTVLHCAETWGGPQGGTDVEDFQAFTTGRTPVEVERTASHLVTLRHPPGAPLQVRSWISANDHQTQGHPEFRRPILNERLFRAVGELFLFTPEHLPDEDPVDIEVTFSGFDEAGFRLACSFGVGTGPLRLHRTPMQLRHAVFLAGDITILERDVLGEPLYVALEDRGWGFTAEEFADTVAGIVESERTFFDDFDHPFYLVTLVPVGVRREGSRSLGGSGLTDSFTLEMSPGVTLADGSDDRREILKLLAHEMFHAWNGMALQREQPARRALWFSEGFTDYYARKLLLDGGFLSAEDHCLLLNRALQGYYTSSVWREPNTRIDADFWSDRAIKDLPYRRGDVVAMLVDHAIRAYSKGERSLDDLMRELVARGTETGWKVTTEKLLDEIERWTDAGFADTIRGIVVDGAVASLPGDLFADTLVRTTERMGVFDLGFDLEASQQAGVVTGVREDSPAARAGLQDGQVLSSWSVRHGNTAEPVVFTIEEDERHRRIEYLPIAEEREVPQFRPRD